MARVQLRWEFEMNPKKMIGEGYSEMGEFWLAGKPNAKIVGMLSIGSRDRVTLRIYEDFPGFDSLQMMFNRRDVEIEAIHGHTRSGLMVGLFKCIHLGDSILTNYMLIGNTLPRHSKLTDYKFTQANVVYHDVQEWLRWTLKLDHKEHDSGIFNIKMREAPSFKFLDCEIKLDYHWNFSYKESELTSENIFSFKFDDAKETDVIKEYTDVFGDFLLLCLNAPVSTKFLCVGTSDSENKIQLVCQKREMNKQREPIFSEVISYWAISNDFQNILHNWFQLGLNREVRDAIALYVESQTGKSVTEITFLILFQACEGIAKRVEPSIYKKKAAKSVLIQLLHSTTAPLLDFLDDVAIDKLAHKTNATRRYWIHNSGDVAKANTFDGFSLLAINSLLSYTLRAYLLTKAGVTQDIIKQYLSPYQGIGTYLLEELKAICSENGTTKTNALE